MEKVLLTWCWLWSEALLLQHRGFQWNKAGRSRWSASTRSAVSLHGSLRHTTHAVVRPARLFRCSGSAKQSCTYQPWSTLRVSALMKKGASRHRRFWRHLLPCRHQWHQTWPRCHRTFTTVVDTQTTPRRTAHYMNT
uniref:Secreted protein n=1 Tax=Rhipicephalus appendiculatus TaxID=34631 RepID=A0A131YHV6_RHIAP